MTINEFRSDPQLPGQWAKELATNGLLRLVLFDVMEEAHPARYAVQADKDDDISPTRASIELGFTRGFSKYADTLKLLSKGKSTAVDVGEPTYQAPPKEEQNG